MKSIFKLMTIAALGAMFVACGDKNNSGVPEGKPVITPEMYSVTANAETGVVVFQFLNDNLSPFWSVKDPNNQEITFTDRNVTKTFELKGLYSGSLIAFGAAGQSDPAEFNFVVGNSDWDPNLSYTQNVLLVNTWKPYYLGWYGGEGEDYWSWREKVDTYLADDRVVFKKDGKLEWNQNGTFQVYNDEVGMEDYSFTGNEGWAYLKEGEKEYMQFSNGGFPGIKGNDSSINGKFEITDVTATSVSLLICIGGEDPNYHMYLTLVPEDWEEPEPSIVTDVTEEEAIAALSGKKFALSDLGWWGGVPDTDTYWDYFTVPNEEVLPAYMLGDYITFGADGSLSYDLKLDDPIADGGSSGHFIYNDGVGGIDCAISGSEKWSVITEASVTKVSFSGGGFPLVIAGKDDNSSDPDYWFGRDGKWTISSIDVDGTVRLEIFQSFNEQWLTILLTPVS